MGYTVSKEGGKAKFEFEITQAEWDAATVRAYEASKDKYSMPGFRKGKVPMRVLLRSYGEGMFFDDAFNDVFSKSFGEALDKEPDIRPVDRPDVHLDGMDGKTVKFSATVTMRPTVTLGAYTGLKLPKADYSVKPGDVDAEIDRALTRAARKIEITDRAAQNGDIVNLDYSGAVDGEKFPGGTAEKQELEIGSNTFIPGFEEQLIGLKPGDEKAVNVTFPAEYHEESLKGKAAVFMCKLNGIYKKEKPVFDDEFAKDTSKFESAEDYKKDIEERLTADGKRREDTEDENTLLKTIVDAAEAELPESMIDEYGERLKKDFETRLMYQGMKLEDYLKYANMTEESLKEAQRPQARQGVMTRLVIEDILKAEKITAEEQDFESKFASLAEAEGKSVSEFKKTLDHRRFDYIENDILMDKLLAFLKKNNEYVPKAAEDGESGEKAGPKTSGGEKAAKSGGKTPKSGEKTPKSDNKQQKQTKK